MAKDQHTDGEVTETPVKSKRQMERHESESATSEASKPESLPEEVNDTDHEESEDDLDNSTADKRQKRARDSVEDEESEVEKPAKKRKPGRPAKSKLTEKVTTEKNKVGRPKGTTKKALRGLSESEDSEASKDDVTEEEVLPNLVAWSEQLSREDKVYWNDKHEQKLQADWTDEDEAYITTSNAKESALWKKAARIFRKPAPEILPPNVRVLTERKKKAATDDGGDVDATIELPVTWNSEFCGAFGKLICCPHFEKRNQYLIYVLEYALWRRVGEKKGREKPDEKMLSTKRDDKLLEAVEDVLDLTLRPDEDESLITRIHNVIGPDLPPHSDFVKCLLKVVKQGWGLNVENGSDLQVRDLHNIIDAWDMYAKNRKPKLPSMNEYMREYNKAHPTKGPQKRGRQKLDEWFKVAKRAYRNSIKRQIAIEQLRKRAENERASERKLLPVLNPPIHNKGEKTSKPAEDKRASERESSPLLNPPFRNMGGKKLKSTEDTRASERDLSPIQDPLLPNRGEKKSNPAGRPKKTAPAKRRRAPEKAVSRDDVPERKSSMAAQDHVQDDMGFGGSGGSVPLTHHDGTQVDRQKTPEHVDGWPASLNAFRRACDDAGLHRRETQPEELDEETLKGLDFDRRPGATTQWALAKDGKETLDTFKDISGSTALGKNMMSWASRKPCTK
jgi:hypothetical protein